MATAPSGEQFLLRHGPYEAAVVEVGGGIRTLTHHGEPLLQGYDEGAICDGARGQLLLPWPNRVDGGRYTFAGEERQLDLSEPSAGCAIHGLTRWANWRCTARDAAGVTLEHRLHPHPGFPHTLDLAVEHRLADDGLTVAVRATNAGSAPAPFGAGAHPYLTVGAATVDDDELTVPAATVVDTDPRGLPTSRAAVGDRVPDLRGGRTLGALVLDNPFTDLERDGAGRAWARLQHRGGRSVALWADEHHRWLQVFTGDHLGDPGRRRTAVAIEPMTCPPNAFVTGEDLIVLDPGDTVSLRWGIVAG